MLLPLLFWDVDTQFDFMYPDGKLYVPGAEKIVACLGELTQWAAHHGVLIVSSACAHLPGDPEFAQYPPHCVTGTPGQQKIPETRVSDPLTIPNRAVELPLDFLQYRQIVLEKQQLDVFSNPNTHRLMQKLGKERDVILYGVVTEICVAYTARGLMRCGWRAVIVSDATRYLDESRSRAFLEEFGKSGGSLLSTRDLLAKLSRDLAA